MPRRYILTASERVLVAIPTDETALIRLYTLSEQDLSVIKQRRGDANRLGFAVLLCCLRYPGYALPAGEDPPHTFLTMISAHAVLLATNHETVEVKVAPIECDLEQVVQHCDAAVAGHVQTPPYRRVDLEEQDVELVNFGRSVWLDHSRPRSLVVALISPRFFPVTASSSPSGNCRPQVASHRPQSGVGLGLAPHACPGKEALAQVAD